MRGFGRKRYPFRPVPLVPVQVDSAIPFAILRAVLTILLSVELGASSIPSSFLADPTGLACLAVALWCALVSVELAERLPCSAVLAFARPILKVSHRDRHRTCGLDRDIGFHVAGSPSPLVVRIAQARRDTRHAPMAGFN